MLRRHNKLKHRAGGTLDQKRFSINRQRQRFAHLPPACVLLGIASLAAFLMAGCAVGPNFKPPAAPPVANYTGHSLPDTVTTTNLPGGEAQRFANGGDIAGDWWALFHSPPLNELIQLSLSNNPDLKAAQAALLVARENVLAQRGVYFPVVTGRLSAPRQKQAGTLAPVPNSNTFQYNLFTPQVSVSYSPDVFGLNRRTMESVKAQEQAIRFQMIATYTTLTANVVVTAIQAAAVQAQIDATRQLVVLNSNMLQILRYQYLKGYAGRLDVVAQESQLAQVNASLPPLLKQSAQLRDLLAVLAGGFPNQAPLEKFELSDLRLPVEIPVSLPSQLVAQRPDVLQAEANLHAATAQIGVAMANRLPDLVFLASREPVGLSRPVRRFGVDKPEPIEQRALWAEALGPAAAHFNGTLNQVADQFRLSAKTIFATGSTLGRQGGELPPAALWQTCRSLARPRLENLACRIVPRARWDDLVLPVHLKQTLRQLVSQARQRMLVYETWGFAGQGGRGLGISALFAGDSGTGKTMAAEVLAGELGLDLYRIDLSSVVSKYIGETEKNLKQVFDAAEQGGVLLLFDEADALFGKRGEVKDSHDRYANIEVSYLLQRIETFQGLAILTTNLKTSIDRAFQRRLRFIVNFPFPDAEQRAAIWTRVFPAQTPVRGLEPKRLAQLNVAGGNIRNMALNAAFLAAEQGDGRPVEMTHLVQAAKLEAQKIERPLSEAEIRGWL